jgi:hypothetical protein
MMLDDDSSSLETVTGTVTKTVTRDGGIKGDVPPSHGVLFD